LKHQYKNLSKLNSNYTNCVDQSDILATSTYGHQSTCSINRDNICGVQFHPEKSHRFGLTFFKNFLRKIENV